MPIIAAISGVNSGTLMKFAKSSTSERPIAIPKIALRRGSPIASREPKVKKRIKIAASSPTASAPPGACCCETRITSPEYSI